jgi:hypothetical protein
MAYHTKEIKKGTIGEFSKIQEEYEELLDAYNQGDSLLQLNELSDLIGAIGLYSQEKWNISLIELVAFSEKTKQAFLSGKRK